MEARTRSSLGTGAYTTGEVARLAGLERQRVRRWVRGYTYRDRRGESRRGGRLFEISRGFEADEPAELTFDDLLEIIFVKKFLQLGVSMTTIKRAAVAARADFGASHPFSLRRFETDGSGVFARITDRDGDEHVYNLVTRQVGLSTILSPIFKRIDYESGEAVRYNPLGRRRPVVIDPTRNFGAPVTRSSGVPTRAIYSAYQAGESALSIAKWYGATPAEVRAAIELEQDLRDGRAA